MNSLRLYSSRLTNPPRIGSYSFPWPNPMGWCLKQMRSGSCKEGPGQTIGRAFLASYTGFQNSPVAISSSEMPGNDFTGNNRIISRQALFPTFAGSVMLRKQFFWSNSGGQHDNLQDKISSSASMGDSSSVSMGDSSFQNHGGSSGNSWSEILNQAYHSISDASVRAAERAKEASNELTPYVNQLMDSHPYLRDVIVPVGGTFSATLLAWLVMPRLLRRLYKYRLGSPLSLLTGRASQEQIPYERSLWSALEDPARYLVTFMAFLQLAAIAVPSTSIYLSQTWRGALVLSFLWFLQRWKGNVISRNLSDGMAVIDREKLLALDKISSVALLVLGAMGFAEACGVAVHSILTVGGIGGVATAFAAKDILGNLFNGLFLQFSKPFSIGDNIKAGPIEGQVVEIGLTATCLLNMERFPVMVPNSLFSSQVIVNKSRAQWRAVVSKIPVCISDVEKIPPISEDIKSMLRLYPKVYLGKEAPYCFLSHVENSYAELTVGCNLARMTRDELYAARQDILLQAVKIIKKHGAELGRTICDLNIQ